MIHLRGEATATSAQYGVRRLHKGDLIAKGEVLRTAKDAELNLASEEGSTKHISEKQIVTIDAEFLPSFTTNSSSDGAFLSGSGEIKTLLTQLATARV